MSCIIIQDLWWPTHLRGQYSGAEEIVQGFKRHFAKFAEHTENTNFDGEYYKYTEIEIKHISDLVSSKDIEPASLEEL